MIAKSGGQNALAVEWLKKAERLAEMDDTIDVYTVQSKLLSMVHAVGINLHCMIFSQIMQSTVRIPQSVSSSFL